MVFGKILGVEQQISLMNAFNGAGIIFQGKAHSAVANSSVARYGRTYEKVKKRIYCRSNVYYIIKSYM